MIPLSIISMFVRALGSTVAVTNGQNAQRIQQYAEKAAKLIDMAETGRVTFEIASAKLEADGQQMQKWVDSGYDPADSDFDELEAHIDELHDRYAAAAATSG